METFDCSNKNELERLYLRVGRHALSKTRYLVGGNVAEEIVQETFLKLWNSKVKFEDIRSAYSWIYRTCTHAAIDYLRKAKKLSKESLPEDIVEASRFSAEEKLALQQLYSGFIGKLDSQESAYFIYKYVEGLKQEEMVEVMGVSRRTVARLHDKVEAKLENFRKKNEF